MTSQQSGSLALFLSTEVLVVYVMAIAKSLRPLLLKPTLLGRVRDWRNLAILVCPTASNRLLEPLT